MSKCKSGYYYCYTDKKCKPISKGMKVTARFSGGEKEPEEVGIDKPLNGNDTNGNGNGNGGSNGGVSEGTLHKWFKGSKSKDGKGGWVNVVTGGTCASDEPGEGTPKCVSSAKRASMSKAERLSAQRRKKKADPGQQQKSGAAKPTYVSTDPKKKMKEEVTNVDERADFWHPDPEKDRKLGGPGANQRAREDRAAASKPKEDPKKLRSGESYMDYAKRHGYKSSTKKKSLLGRLGLKKEEVQVTEAKDKKGKGSGTKDACYHKVKSRYSVWPSAYASGALVKCRKVGAANWGNKSESFEYSNWRSELEEAKKCWPGYEKKGTKKMFGKTYNNCVKKEETEIEEAPKYDKQGLDKFDRSKRMIRHKQDKYGVSTLKQRIMHGGVDHNIDNEKKAKKAEVKEEFSDWRSEIEEGAAWTKKSGKNPSGGLNEKGRKSYERENPGSDLKAPSKKVGNKRRASFCARMKGMKKKLTSAKTANDPDSRINKSLRAWNC